MFATVSIEKIGNPRLGFQPAWVDLVKDIGPHGMVKERMRGQSDYSQANSVGSRGVFVHYWLQLGELYHISAPRNFKRSDQYSALSRKPARSCGWTSRRQCNGC